jgi:hypothetical protein
MVFRGLSDFFMSDVTVDRLNSSFRDPAMNCRVAYYYPSLIPPSSPSSAAIISSSALCRSLYPQWDWTFAKLFKPGRLNALQTFSSYRFHFIRLLNFIFY